MSFKVKEEVDKKGNTHIKTDLDNLIIDNKLFDREYHIHRFMIGGIAGDSSYDDIKDNLNQMFHEVYNFLTYITDNKFDYKNDTDRNTYIIENYAINYYTHFSKANKDDKFSVKFHEECINKSKEKIKDIEKYDLIFNKNKYYIDDLIEKFINNTENIADRCDKDYSLMSVKDIKKAFKNKEITADKLFNTILSKSKEM